jgi:hypothetical protein
MSNTLPASSPNITLYIGLFFITNTFIVYKQNVTIKELEQKLKNSDQKELMIIRKHQLIQKNTIIKANQIIEKYKKILYATIVPKDDDNFDSQDEIFKKFMNKYSNFNSYCNIEIKDKSDYLTENNCNLDFFTDII